MKQELSQEQLTVRFPVHYCDKAEDGIKTTPCSQCALNALAIDEPLEYAKLYLDGTMQIWVDAEDSIEL